MGGVDPRVEGIRSILVRLRTRSGLSAERLELTEVDIRPLINLPVIRSYIRASGLQPIEAVVRAMRLLAAQLPVSEMLIVDAALALRLIDDDDQAFADHHYARDLGDRREHLVDHWPELHERRGAGAGPRRPSVRKLRTTLEPRALGKLAELCVASTTLEPQPGADVPPDPKEQPASSASVVVVGGAVMDHILLVDHVAAAGTSVQASSFTRDPGGKGLIQAVALGRLGLRAQLLTAVGEDGFGNSIVDYLTREGLSTSLVKRVPARSTPVTIVIEDITGNSAVTAWRNEAEIRLDQADFERHATRAAMVEADAVLLTFETPVDSIQNALRLLENTSARVVVRPSPPLDTPQLIYEFLPRVDYLVGTPWELRHLLPEPDNDATVEQLATLLLNLNIDTVCIIERFGCMLRSNQLRLDVGPVETALQDTPGARDAFIASLTLRILETEGNLTLNDLSWAVAAMMAIKPFRRIPTSMPSADDIDHRLATTPEFEAP